MQEALTKPCIFGIDDAHWIDHDSWSFLLDLALDPNAILVLTSRPLERLKEKHPAMLEILNHPHTKLVKLEGLKLEDMITLACRLLKVEELPDLMQQIIRKRSHGVPLWCEELVETMLEMNYLEIIEKDDVITEEEEEESEDQFYDDLPSISRTMSHNNGRKVVMKAKPRRCSTAQLTRGLSIGDIPIPDSVAGMVLTRIDRLSPPGQMSLKCASVIGTVFNKAMLEAIIPNCTPPVFHQSLNPLAEAGMIECAVAAQIRSMHTDMDTRSKSHLPVDDPHLHCPCLHRDYSHLKPTPGHKQHISVHPPVDECHTLQFVHTYLQETAYGLWTERQRKALHESAAVYLESQAHKCTHCGGGGFIAGGAQRPSVSVQGKRPSVSRGSGRAFVGAASMKNKLKRRNTVASRRGSTVSGSESRESPTVDLEAVRTSLNRRLTDPIPPSSNPRSEGVRFESICASDLIDIDLQDCHCDEVLASVYPQLVCHWRAAGNMRKTLHYLIESGSAAVATFNNMEALSLLNEAMHDIVEEHGRDIISDSDYARLESLIAQVSPPTSHPGWIPAAGCTRTPLTVQCTLICLNMVTLHTHILIIAPIFLQALFQSGEIEESLPHFKTALRLLHTRLPEGRITSTFALGYHAFKQFLHRKFPRRFIGSKSGRDSEMFLDQARCMTHVTHVYHLQHDNLKTLMVALKQLNTVEEAQEDIHEVCVCVCVCVCARPHMLIPTHCQSAWLHLFVYCA